MGTRAASWPSRDLVACVADHCTGVVGVKYLCPAYRLGVLAMVDVGAMLDAAWPYLTAVFRGYGSALVARVSDEGADATADATVFLGRRLWRRLFGSASGAAVQEAAVEAVEHPDDADYLAGLRLQMKKVLAADPAVAGAFADLLRAGGAGIVASGARSVAVRTNSGIIATGDSTTIRR